MKTAIKPLAIATAISIASMAAMVAPAHAELTGNIGVFSQYVLRGITNAPENDNAAIQGGLDWGHDSGFFVGYWGSNLGYGDAGSDTKGFENDFYAGWGGEAGSINWNLGATYYYYLNISDFNALEPFAYVGFGPATFGFKYLAEDVAWGNQGDTYWTLDASHEIGAGFTLAGTIGYYSYEKDGEFIPDVPNSGAIGSGFRHFNIDLSHPIGNTGADMALTYIVGGDDRFGVEQDNQIVLSLTYGFDIAK